MTPSERLARSARCSPTPAESENILFSPYPVNPNPGHNYNTRAAARQKQRATPSVSVDGTDATSVQMSAEEEERARAVSRYRTEALLAHETLDVSVGVRVVAIMINFTPT